MSRRRRRFPSLRSCATAIALTLLVFWLGSTIVWVCLATPRGYTLTLNSGLLHLGHFPDDHSSYSFRGGVHPFEIEWRREHWSDPRFWVVRFPLWIPAAVSLCLAAIVWLPAILARRIPPGTCKRCRYDLTGLPPGTLCPECGGAPHDPRPPPHEEPSTRPSQPADSA